NRERFNEELEAVFTTRSTADWMERFAGKVPAAPVYDVAQALDNPFVHARGCLLDAYDAQSQAVTSVAPPIRCPGEAPLARAAPAMRADTDELLAQAGYDAGQIARLRKSAVLRRQRSKRPAAGLAIFSSPPRWSTRYGRPGTQWAAC